MDEEKTLASEMLMELKASNRRLFMGLVVVLALWFLTIGGFIIYLSLPVEEVSVEQDVDGNANRIIGIGDVDYGSNSENYDTQETRS